MNNFDQSSNCVNLELSVSFDLCLAQHYFNENFTNVYRSGGSLLNDHYSRTDVWLYTAGGSISEDFDLADLDNYNLSSTTNKNLLANIRVGFYGSSEELKEDSLHYFNKYPYQLNKLELIELVENAFNEDYQEFLTDNFDPLFEVLSISGYSQGDYTEIILTHKLLEQYTFEDKEKFLSSMEDYFTNLFYDAPLYARLEVEEQEYYFDDFQEDRYSYDKDQILQQANKIIDHKEKTYIINWLEENLPDQPEYI